jgi:hypothetical protein
MPAKDDALGIDDYKASGNETRVLEFLFGDLAFAFKGVEIGSPGYRFCGHEFVAGNLYGLDRIPLLGYPNYFIEMAWIMANPLAC